MSRSNRVWLLGLFTVVAGVWVLQRGLHAARYGAMAVPAPEFPPPGVNVSGTTWINSPPLTLASLKGKVVLVDFWEYTCINCIRTFETNKRWYRRYHADGLEIVGVHDPEFDIAYPVDHVREAVQRFGLPYPVVVDDWFRIWKAYNNSTWPNRFLIDAKGVIRFNVPGEGNDDAFEKAIQLLLQEAHPGLNFPAADAIPAAPDAFGSRCGVPTEEMYVGDWYGRGVLANPEGYRDGKTVAYSLPAAGAADVDDGRVMLAGRWETGKNGMTFRGGAPGPQQLVLRYHAREIYAVLNVAHGHPTRLYLRQDGRDLTAADRGADVQLDANGHSYITVNPARMYYLAQNPSFGSHRLELLPTDPGLTVNSFVFGNNCQTDFPHR